MHRIFFRRGEGCVYTRCPYCDAFIAEQTDGSRAGNQRAKDKVGEALAEHANENHLPEEQ
jgi:hypothetical protein